MKKKGLVSALLTASMLIGLVGCGSTGNSGSTAATTAGAGSNVETTANAGSNNEEKIQISLWHVWPENNGGTAASFVKTLEQVNEKYPEVEFVIDAVADSGDAYKTKIKTAIAGGEAPDIFYTWGGGFAESFVKAGKVLCLDEYIPTEMSDKFLAGTTDFFVYDEKLYGFPTRVNIGLLFCNKTMFEEAGLEIPENYDELLEVAEAFKADGTIPICISAKDSSTTMWWTNALAMREAGAPYVNQVLAGDATFDTPEMQNSAELFRGLIDAGAFDPGAMSMSRDECQAVFLTGKYPMYLCGSWFCASVMDSELKDDIVVANIPITNGKGLATEFLGGADQTFMINSATKNPEKVAEVCAYMCEKFSENVFLNGAGLPAWKTEVDTSAVENRLLVDTYHLFENSTGVVLWWDNALSGEQATEHLESVTKLYMGSVTAEEFTQINKDIMQ